LAVVVDLAVVVVAVMVQVVFVVQARVVHVEFELGVAKF
jgi:hypothetical protein